MSGLRWTISKWTDAEGALWQLVNGPDAKLETVAPESELSLSLAREQRLREALKEIAECSFFPTRPVGEQVVYGLEGGPVKARMVAPVDSAVWMRERARDALSSVPDEEDA